MIFYEDNHNKMKNSVIMQRGYNFFNNTFQQASKRMTLDVIPSSQIAFIQYDKEIRNLNLLQRYNCDRCFVYTMI